MEAKKNLTMDEPRTNGPIGGALNGPGPWAATRKSPPGCPVNHIQNRKDHGNECIWNHSDKVARQHKIGRVLYLPGPCYILTKPVNDTHNLGRLRSKILPAKSGLPRSCDSSWAKVHWSPREHFFLSHCTSIFSLHGTGLIQKEIGWEWTTWTTPILQRKKVSWQEASLHVIGYPSCPPRNKHGWEISKKWASHCISSSHHKSENDRTQLGIFQPRQWLLEGMSLSTPVL